VNDREGDRRTGRSVVIVGAGPAGAALSLLLARKDIAVTLVERERDFARVFRGEGLMPSGLDALYQMGLREKLDSLPWRHLESWEIHLDGRLAMSITEPTAALGDLALRVVSQAHLLELLIAEAKQYPHFEFMSAVTVRDLKRDGAVVRGVVASTPDGERVIDADLTIGADGRASTLRKRRELPFEPIPESYDVLWMKLPLPEELAGRSPVLILASGPEVALAYVSWDQRLQLAWMLPKGGWREIRERDWLGQCAKLMPDWLARHVLARRGEMDGPIPLDVMVGRCPRWSAPGLLLIGDAAHPMSPVRAQGINMALRDAIVAANHLAPALSADADLGATLATIQAEREREIRRVQELQFRELRGQRWARARPWLMKPLLAIVPLLAMTGLPQRAWLRQQRALPFGVTEVKLQA